MSKVELRLNVLIEAYKNKMDEIRKLNELEKAFLDDELEVNHNEQMFTQFKGIDKYDFDFRRRIPGEAGLCEEKF